MDPRDQKRSAYALTFPLNNTDNLSDDIRPEYSLCATHDVYINMQNITLFFSELIFSIIEYWI